MASPPRTRIRPSAPRRAEPDAPTGPARRRAEDDAPTRERLLAATERLIGEGGIEALSMRAVTRAAGLSVSAANYHFGSKEALVREALLRALGPLSAERLERVEVLEAAARREGRTPGVEELVEAFLRPAFALRSREREGSASPSRAYRLLWARLHLGNSQVAEEVKHELLNPAFRRYLDALARSLPDRDREDLALAFQLALGSALHVLGGHAEQLADLEPLEDEALLRRLVRFAASGIRAAARSGPGEPT